MKNKNIIDIDCDSILNSINFKNIKNKTILVTGASGLVGIYIVSCLVKLKNNLNLNIFCCVKNKPTKEFIEIFNQCNLIVSDITDENAFSELPNFDYIIHSAGYGQPLKFLEDELKTIKLNTSTTLSLFKKLKVDGTFLFISSTEVYSGLNDSNILESLIGSTNTDHPRCCYIEGKRSGEAICHIYSRKGYNVKIARLGHTYGPGVKKNDKRVLNSLIDKALIDKKISLLDDGSSVRIFCYISDVCEMLFNILLFGKDITYNVTGNEELSILQLSKIIADKLNVSVDIPFISANLTGSPSIVNASNQKYLNEFYKEKFIKIENGIVNTIEWQKLLLEI